MCVCGDITQDQVSLCLTHSSFLVEVTGRLSAQHFLHTEHVYRLTDSSSHSVYLETRRDECVRPAEGNKGNAETMYDYKDAPHMCRTCLGNVTFLSFLRPHSDPVAVV